MQWEDEGLILHVGKYSETSAIVTVFTELQGLYRAVMKGGLGKRSRGVLQPGNLVTARWNARLAEHMGNLTAETAVPVAAAVMQDALGLSVVTSLAGLLLATLMERDPHPRLYRSARNTLIALAEGDAHWSEHYVHFELNVLREGGFGLDLSACAATGVKEGLIYVSPKSGKAVSRAAGEPYKEKLLPLPPFLLSRETEQQAPKAAEILDALRLSGYFLEQWLLVPHDRHLPPSRERLMTLLAERTLHLA